MTLPIRFFLLSSSVLLLTSFANAGTAAEVRGIVLDGRDGQAVPSATIHIDGAVLETHTDSFGRFRFASVTAGSHMLQVASPGYKTTETPFAVDAGTTKEFEISLVPYRLEQSSQVKVNEPLGLETARSALDADFEARFSLRGADYTRTGIYYDGLLAPNALHGLEGSGLIGSSSIFSGNHYRTNRYHVVRHVDSWGEGT